MERPRITLASALLLMLVWGLGSARLVQAQDVGAPTPDSAPFGDAPAVEAEDAPTDAPGGSAEPPADVPVPEADAPPRHDDSSELLAVSDGVLDDSESSDAASPRTPIRYLLERVEVRGNRTRAGVIERFVPLHLGELFDVDDPTIERIRWRLLGTGWFDDVKLSLARGSEKGWVVLVIEVQERNTLVLDRFLLGLARVVPQSTTMKDTLRPYAGLAVSETNLFGLGLGVSVAGVVSEHQYGLDLGYQDPMLAGSGFSLTGRAFYNNAREFFGRNPLVSVSCPEPDPQDPAAQCDPDIAGKRAVVIYHRAGFGFGTGHDITGQLRYTLDWLGEYVDVISKPQAASAQRGREIVPIDFRIDDGESFVSSVRFGLVYDRRDHPSLPTRGTLASFQARLASGLFGSSYDFARFEGGLRHYVPLPWHHVLSFGAFAGAVFGEAPFFYNFYAADLSDLLPSRILQLNLDHRRAPNLLGTSIVEMDAEELAARLDFEYQLPLHRGAGVVRGVVAYAGAGVYMLARRDDLRLGISGYEGLARIPLDLTFDIGISADTEIGLLRIGFSSLVGLLPDLGQGNP